MRGKEKPVLDDFYLHLLLLVEKHCPIRWLTLDESWKRFVSSSEVSGAGVRFPLVRHAMEVGTRGNFHAWKLSTLGDGWGVCTRQLNRRIGHPTGKKGEKGRGEKTKKKNEEREIVEHRVEGSILHSAVREKRSWNRTCRLSIDPPRSQPFERSFHRFRIRLISLDYVRTFDATHPCPISSIENRPLLVEKKNMNRISIRIAPRSRREMIGYIRTDWYLVKYFVIIQWGKFKRTMWTTVNYEW